MDKNSKRALVELIEKIAQVPQRKHPRPTAQISPVQKTLKPVNVTSKLPASNPVKQMQQAIQMFATEAVKYNTKSIKDHKNPKAVSNIVDSTDKRKDFNDFLAEQYSAGSRIHGAELTTDQDAVNKEDKQPTNIVELDNVIDGLRRIGPGNKETMPDGIWDFRTNNAVKNVWAFADALVRVTEDFGGTIPNLAFKREDLKKMGEAIPKAKDPKTLDKDDLANRATIIAGLINKLSIFYKSYYKYIINHPAYAQYISKDQPLLKVTPGAKDATAIPEDLKKQNLDPNTLFLKNVTVPGAKGNVDVGNLSLGHLKDLESLQKFMMNFLGYSESDINNPEITNKVLNSISSQVDSVLTPAKV